MDGFIRTCTATSMSRFVDNFNSDVIVGIGRYLEACTRQIHGSKLRRLQLTTPAR
ncbi:hypothetical protein EAG_06893 [Camponotus floridanus]|uniref:Uncharacterized protein n=1 Tax=Camponotus floridanus TaxID=104421 RepID=E2A1N5_CAMFO|nr:hypothetical protein EAG_06893 [Camponotus floridanus]